jgi:hypothetical protein
MKSGGGSWNGGMAGAVSREWCTVAEEPVAATTIGSLCWRTVQGVE